MGSEREQSQPPSRERPPLRDPLTLHHKQRVSVVPSELDSSGFVDHYLGVLRALVKFCAAKLLNIDNSSLSALYASPFPNFTA